MIRDRRGAHLLGCVVLGLALTACRADDPPRAQEEAIVTTDLEHSGVDYPIYRIPALTITNAGTLIAAYDGRPTHADVPSHIALLARRSVDGGKTWLPRQIIREGPEPLGFGDPSLLVDRQTGRIFIFYVASVNQGFFGSATGNDENDPEVQQADVSWSDDDGVSWQHRRITAAIKDPAWSGLFAASGQGIQLTQGPHAGRLIQQYVIRLNGEHYAASAMSDDHGETWRMGRLVGPGLDENKTVELSDGRVMLNSRAKPLRLVAISTDGGESYSEPRGDKTLIDPANNGAIVRFDPTAAPGSARARRLVFSNTADTGERRNLTVRLSCDDGETWPSARTIEPGASAYSTLVTFPNGDIGVLYERGRSESITFARFAPQWPGSCG